MKSPAREGDREPRTVTPSTGVPTRSDGEIGGIPTGSGSASVVMQCRLGEPSDTAG